MEHSSERPQGFRVVMATVGLSLAAAGVPSALYPTYRHEYGLSPLAQTVLFATYAVALFPALLVGGRLLQRYSGSSIAITGVAFVVASDALFAQNTMAAELFGARAVQGIGIGLINAAAGVLALTTRSDGNASRAALGTALATALGLGIGVLGSGVWVKAGPQPTVWPYVLHAGAAVVLCAAISRNVQPAASSSSRDASANPAASRHSWRFVLVCTAVFLAWGYGGLLLAILPDLARRIGDAGAAGPGLLALMFVCVAAAEGLVVRSFTPPRGMVVGLLVLALGGGVVAAAALTTSMVLLAFGSVLLGFGLGATFVSAIASANELIPGHRRNALLPRFYACVFAGNAVPAVITGYLAGRLSLTAAAATVSIALALASLVTTGALVWREQGESRV